MEEQCFQLEEQRSPEVRMEEPRASYRRRTSSDSGPGGWTVVVISLGLLFITQASLNVFLRLYFPSNKVNTSDCTNVTAEKEDLGKLLETSRQDLSKNQDEIKISSDSLNTCQRSLSLKTRELEEKISFLETSRQDLSKNQDEIKRSSASLNTCQRSLSLKTRELEEKISSFETTRRELTEEMDRQKQRLQSIDHYLSRGWMYFSGSVYLGSTTERNWFESRELCQEQGADLVIITSVQEKDFINSLHKDERWIGLSDLQAEGVWRWVDGTTLTTSFWRSGEPNNKNNEDCVEINFKGQEGRWNDRDCGVALPFICERRLDDM